MDMDVDIKKAEEKIEYLSSDPKTMELYKARERSLHERANMISGAREEGIEIGIEIGIEKGIEKGIGKGEDRKAIKVAEKMLKRGDSIEDVVDITELPIDTVMEIKKKMVN